jgi:hypothetical protein
MQRKTTLQERKLSAPILSEAVWASESSGSADYIKNSALNENYSPTYNMKVL